MYAISIPHSTLGRSGTMLTAEQTRMTPEKLAAAVKAGIFTEVYEPGDDAVEEGDEWRRSSSTST